MDSSPAHPLLLRRRLPTLRPPLLRPLTQLPNLPLRLPTLLPLHPADHGILPLAKEIHPMLQTRMDLLPSLPPLLFLERLQLPRRVQRIDSRVVEGNEHVLDAAQIGHAVLGETVRHEGARGVGPGEEMVGAARAVVAGARGHVVDRAVDGE